MTTETDSQDCQSDRQTVNRQPFFLIPCLGFSILSICLSFSVWFLSVSCESENSLNTRWHSFLSRLQAHAAYPASSPHLPSLHLHQPAFHCFHTNFIETQPQAQVRSVPILPSSPPPLHLSRCCVWPTNGRLKFSMYTRNSQNIAARRPFWFYCVFPFFSPLLASRFFSAISFLPLFCCCCCRCCCGVCCRAPSLQRPHCKLSHPPPPSLLGWRTTRQRLCSVDVVVAVVCCRFSFVVVIFVL